MKKFNLAVLFFLLLNSNFAQKCCICGSYIFNTSYDVSYELYIHKDSSFLFNWKNGLLLGSSQGRWIKKGNVIILNSKSVISTEQIIVKEFERNHKDSITIYIHNAEGLPLGEASICINNKYFFSTNISGYFVLKKFNKVKTIKILYPGILKNNYKIKDCTANYFDITVNDSFDFRPVFESLKLKIHKGDKSLIMKKNPYSKKSIVLHKN